MWEEFIGRISGVEFSGRRFDYRPGLYVTDVQGLNGGGAVSSSPIGRAGGPGGLYVPGRRTDERSIVISGFAWARDQFELRKLVDRFGGILPDEDEFEVFSFRELGAWRRVRVGRRGSSTIDRTRRTGKAPFQLVLRAPDQRIYGDAMVTSGWGEQVEVDNRGTHAAPVTVQVRGDLPGYTITGPGGRLAVVTRTLVPGTPHEYDGDEGILTVGGVALDEGVTRSDRIEIPRGIHTVQVTSGAEILVTGSDTYIP